MLCKNEVENKLYKEMKELRIDSGNDYIVLFKSLFEQYRIIHQTTTPQSSQFNEIPNKKKIHTLKEMMNVILISFGIPENMRGEIVLSF